MKKYLSLLLALTMLFTLAVIGPAASAASRPSVSGQNGFAVTTGELFTMLEDLLSDKSSDFYVGDNVSFGRYMPFYPETLEIAYLSYGDANVHVMPALKYTPNHAMETVLPEADSDPFTSINVSGIDQYSGFDMEQAVEKVSAAVIYLTREQIVDYDDAVAFYRSLKQIGGDYGRDGLFAYRSEKEFLGNHGGHDFYSFVFNVKE